MRPSSAALDIMYVYCRIGRGAVYGYDAVGSFKRDEYGCMGSGQNYVMPILDNLVGI
jgi:20S proteasome alpha/beta subunit